MLGRKLPPFMVLGAVLLASAAAPATTHAAPVSLVQGSSVSPGEVLAASADSRAARSREVTGPVVAAAGDIACDPNDSNFAGGRGRRGECKMKATARVILDRDPDTVLILGDVQYDDGKKWKYRRSYDRSWGRFKDITRPAIGNHEYYTPRADGYFDYFHRRAGERGKAYYSFDLGTWHLIALNSNCEIVRCAKGSRQYRWLRNDLAASGASCTLAYMHHPRFSTGPHGETKMVRPLWRLLYGAGADLVLAGHDHNYERFAPQKPDGSLDRETGMRQFVVGTGGAQTYWFASRDPQSQVRSADSMGVLFLTLGDGVYAWDFKRAAGDRFSDSGTGVCH